MFCSTRSCMEWLEAIIWAGYFTIRASMPFKTFIFRGKQRCNYGLSSFRYCSILFCRVLLYLFFRKIMWLIQQNAFIKHSIVHDSLSFYLVLQGMDVRRRRYVIVSYEEWKNMTHSDETSRKCLKVIFQICWF